MSKQNLSFHKTNLVISGIAVLIIVVGFILMSGPSTSIEGFEPDIFSVIRIKVAPITTLVGFILMIVGILYPDKKGKENSAIKK